MVERLIDHTRCDGCGKCVDICNLGLWKLEVVDGKNVACALDRAAGACHFCFFCKDICPHNAITIACKEDELMGRIVG